MNEVLYLLSTISMMLMLGCVVALQWQIEQLQQRPAPVKMKVVAKKTLPVRPSGLAFIGTRTLQVGRVTNEGLAEVDGARILVPEDVPVGTHLALVTLGA